MLAFAAPGFFSRENLGDLLLGNLPVLLVAIGATLVILTGEIDISVGSQFAICGVAAGVAAHAGFPIAGIILVSCGLGAVLGSVNGALVAYVGLPSIVVTLATMVAWRDGAALDDAGSVDSGFAGDVPVARPLAALVSGRRVRARGVPAAGSDVGSSPRGAGARHLRDGLRRECCAARGHSRPRS